MLLHINSYYKVGSFYDQLYQRQKDIFVFAPVAQTGAKAPAACPSYAHVCPCYSKLDRYCFQLKQHKIYRTLMKVGKGEPAPTLIHAHTLFTNGYSAYRLNQKYGIPFIVAVRNTDVNSFFKKRFLLRVTGVAILKAASKVVFLSPSYAENALRPYVRQAELEAIRRKSVVIPNGIDPFWLENSYGERRGRDSDGIIKILCVGRIERVKNMIALADACRLLLDKGMNIELHIVGKKIDARVYRALTSRPYVKCFPACPKEELIKHYRECDVFALLSRTETFGLVYAEAMSQGLPVIYSRGQGFDGQFEEGQVGYSADCRNAAEIAEKLELALAHRVELSRNAIRLCAKFDWAKIAREYEQLYQACVAPCSEVRA